MEGGPSKEPGEGEWGLDVLVFVLNGMNITLLDLFLEFILWIYSCPTVVVCPVILLLLVSSQVISGFLRHHVTHTTSTTLLTGLKIVLFAMLFNNNFFIH